MAAGSHLRSGLSSSALVDCGVDCSRSFCCGEATTLGCSRRGYEVSLQRNVRDDESERRLRILQLNPERVSRLDSYSLCASEWHAAMGSNSRADWINSSKWEASLCSGTLERGRKVQCSRVRAQDGSGGRQNQLSFHCIGLHRENLRGVHTRDDFMNPVTRKRTGGKKIGVTSSRISATLDPYETLGVPKSASEKEIKQAYRKMALKFHPDVNKQPDAQQKFLQIKAAYQTLVDAKSRAKYDSSNRATPKWDPFSWETESSSAQKPQEEEFYGFGQFFKDVQISIEDFLRDLQADSRKRETTQAKPKSLWEELADVGEELVEFLEKELKIQETNEDKKSSDYYDPRDSKRNAWNDEREPYEPRPPDEQTEGKAQVESEIAEIEEMLAKIKKELGI